VSSTGITTGDLPGRQNIHRTDNIGVIFIAASQTFKFSLSLAVVFFRVTAVWAFLAGIVRRNFDKFSSQAF
jgi:hypothetical protein